MITGKAEGRCTLKHEAGGGPAQPGIDVKLRRSFQWHFNPRIALPQGGFLPLKKKEMREEAAGHPQKGEP
jgi:hypothetical protein